ncbi:hypothetical protein CMO96_02590 [Candidatus Woesebacteria bacterium]|nr:hypothetical protein [Candidatus Woesebacteria bacterium]|tara:strand:- start:98 stop:520 length:423 start_codon:yes stop_codon:yes gene_type:complete
MEDQKRWKDSDLDQKPDSTSDDPGPESVPFESPDDEGQLMGVVMDVGAMVRSQMIMLVFASDMLAILSYTSYSLLAFMCTGTIIAFIKNFDFRFIAGISCLGFLSIAIIAHVSYRKLNQLLSPEIKKAVRDSLTRKKPST